MSHRIRRFFLLVVLFIPLCSLFLGSDSTEPLLHPEEKRLRNIKQLTFGGTNAEAYFSFDESKLIFQTTRPPFACDQIFTMNINGSEQRLVSTGNGRTTCGYFLPGDREIIYASTHLSENDCPPPSDRSKGYVWGVFRSYNIIIANADGSNPRPFIVSDGYDAEATISPTGDKMVFTSSRDGDLELYVATLDGKAMKRITYDIGYDGGANFSWDGTMIVWRGYHPQDSSGIAEYRSLLAEELVRPTIMEIFIADSDGINKRQLTNNGAANFAPIFHPDNKRIIFSSNMHRPRGRNFHLYIMNIDGTNLQQITYGDGFNSFPMFTRDGKKLVFVSDRNAKERYEFNVFLADWLD